MRLTPRGMANLDERLTVTKSTCLTDSCGRPSVSRGLCSRCYQRLRKHGGLDNFPTIDVGQPTTAIAPVPIEFGSSVLPNRMWQRIVVMPDGRWRWAGCLNPKGYGLVRVLIPGRGSVGRAVHVVTYEAFIGPVPAGLVVGHACHDIDLSCPGGDTCEHRAHCHPACLEVMTGLENARRGRRHPRTTHCPRGHEYTVENTYYTTNKYGNIKKQCKECNRIRAREYRRAKRLTIIS